MWKAPAKHRATRPRPFPFPFPFPFRVPVPRSRSAFPFRVRVPVPRSRSAFPFPFRVPIPVPRSRSRSRSAFAFRVRVPRSRSRSRSAFAFPFPRRLTDVFDGEMGLFSVENLPIGVRIAPMSSRRKMVQLSFADRPTKNGTARKKPGPKAAPRAAVRHRTRPVHRAYHPLHVTMRVDRAVPNLRTQLLYRALERAFRTTRRDDFRIVEYSVQENHLHMIVEANDNDALSRGMKSFSVRANRLLNAASGRKRGRVWGDRYHRRDLTSPQQVRNALVYCLSNYKKHLGLSRGQSRIDFCASARWFQGWTGIRAEEPDPRPTEEAMTFLLAIGWRRRGLIHPGEYPRLPS